MRFITVFKETGDVEVERLRWREMKNQLIIKENESHACYLIDKNT